MSTTCSCTVYGSVHHSKRILYFGMPIKFDAEWQKTWSKVRGEACITARGGFHSLVGCEPHHQNWWLSKLLRCGSISKSLFPTRFVLCSALFARWAKICLEACGSHQKHSIFTKCSVSRSIAVSRSDVVFTSSNDWDNFQTAQKRRFFLLKSIQNSTLGVIISEQFFARPIFPLGAMPKFWIHGTSATAIYMSLHTIVHWVHSGIPSYQLFQFGSFQKITRRHHFLTFLHTDDAQAIMRRQVMRPLPINDNLLQLLARPQSDIIWFNYASTPLFPQCRYQI